MWLVLFACGSQAPDVEAYAEALRSGACAGVRDGKLRDDCWIARVERDGSDVCDRVEDPKQRDECGFQRAEHHDDVALCANAGQFADDCRMHLLSRSFRDLARTGGPADHEAEVAAAIAAAGLGGDDLRPWSAWYRESLSRQTPLDRGACDAVSDPTRAEACRRTGLSLYGDRLNRARDTGRYPCDGGPLPPELTTAPDPGIEELRRSRVDLCAR